MIRPVDVALATAGGILVYSGLTGDTVGGTVRTLLAGKVPAGHTQAAPAVSSLAGTAGTAAPGNTGASSPSAASNQSLARMLAVSLGHPDWISGAEWADWVSLWNQESNWLTTAVNPNSGATGIPQLLPSAHAIPPGWSSATVQITWGIEYIAGTYGSPSKAWQHEQSHGWY